MWLPENVGHRFALRKLDNSVGALLEDDKIANSITLPGYRLSPLNRIAVWRSYCATATARGPNRMTSIWRLPQVDLGDFVRPAADFVE